MPAPSSKRNTPACDFLVVGGGVMGLASAVALAGEGLTVTLVERAPGPAAESTGAAAGIVSLLYPWDYPAPLQALASVSVGLYPAWCERLTTEVGWCRPGLLSFDADTAPPEFPRISAAGARDRVPGLAPPTPDALWLPDVASVEPKRLAAALSERADALGVERRWQASVDEVIVERGAARGVMLADGTRVDADAVLVSAGAWSQALLRRIGLTVPVRPVRGQVVELAGPPGLLPHIVTYGHRYLLPRPDGRLVIGSTSEEVGFDSAVTDEVGATLKALAATLLPATAELPVRGHWAGLRPASPDGLPLIGPVPDVDGLWLNLGHFRNGITLAPGSAALLAALVTGRPPPVSPAAFLPYNLQATDA